MNQQDIKNEILDRIRSGRPKSCPLPEVPSYECPGDPLKNFIDHLLSFDGKAIKFKTRDQAIEWLRSLPEMDLGKRAVYSAVSDIEGNVTEEDVADLHDANKIETCVAESGMGVGEMGSVWVSDKDLRHAACALFSRRLFILLDSKKIIGGMHEAYASLSLADHQYGSFFTGPSATADIEAVHITGAQGPLALTVILYNCENAPAEPELLVSPTADSSPWQK